MDIRMCLPVWRVLWSGIAPAAAVALLAGCQIYEPSPLNFDAHRAGLSGRVDAVEPISAFVERLEGMGTDVPAGFSMTDGVSVGEAEVLALFYNADLRAARLRAGVALADYETAGLWEDPELGFDGAEILAPSGSPFEFGLTLSLTIPISGRLGVEKDRAGEMYEAELRRIVDAEWTKRAQVRSAWAAWTVSLNRLSLLQDTVEQTERIVAIADRLERAGELTRVEVRLLRAALVQTRSDVAQAQRDEVRTRVALLGLMGLVPDAEVRLLPSLALRETPTAGDPITRLIEANTMLAVRRAEYQVAEETLRLEVRKQYPDITIGSGYGSEDNDDRLLLGISLPIPSLNANRAGIADARAHREVARAAAETAFEQLARELANAQAELASVQSQLAFYQNELVPMLDEQTSEVDQLAELGEVDTFVLLETVTQTYATKSRLLDLRAAEIAAATEIKRLLGPGEAASPAPVASSPEGDSAADNTTTGPATGHTPAQEASR
ncbi:MAG: TolC family protein [Planctomycetota bacterium]